MAGHSLVYRAGTRRAGQVHSRVPLACFPLYARANERAAEAANAPGNVLCYVTRGQHARDMQPRDPAALEKERGKKKKEEDTRRILPVTTADAISRCAPICTCRGAVNKLGGGCNRQRGYRVLVSDRSCISPKCEYIVQSLTSNVTSVR